MYSVALGITIVVMCTMKSLGNNILLKCLLSKYGVVAILMFALPMNEALACELSASSSHSVRYQACPDSPVMATNLLIQHLKEGRRQKAKTLYIQLKKRFPDFGPLRQLAQQYHLTGTNEDPFILIAKLTATKLQSHNEAYRPLALDLQPPEKPELPPLPELVKGEFEKTSTFKNRVQQAQTKRQHQVAEIEKSYQQSVASFNRAVENNNAANQQKLAAHKAAMTAKRQQFMAQAIQEILGEPELTQLQYDADAELFHGKILASNGGYEQAIMVPVPINEAQAFKDQANSLKPVLSFSLDNNKLQLKSIAIELKQRQYVAQLGDGKYQAKTLAVRIEDTALPNFNRIETLTPQSANPVYSKDDAYFAAALQLENDPELARLRQRQAELERKTQEAQAAKEREFQAERLLAQIAQQKLELASLGIADYKGLQRVTQWQFPRQARKSNTLAVIIGNRNYPKGVPPVHYAHNDAKAVRQFVEQVWLLPPENIIYEEDASKGVMEGIFRSQLPSLVRSGVSNVIVYFSGHGLATSDQDAKLLPVDARPTTASVTGYSRAALIKQLESLSALGLKSYTLALDACYTGASKEGGALLAGKPAGLKVRTLSRPQQGVVMAAARGSEIAWMNDQTGHSLFTYYFLRGLKGEADTNKDDRVFSNELAAYLQQQVNRDALKIHNQPQRPETTGQNLELVSFQ